MPTATANGKTFNFPEGTSPEQMGQAIDEYFSSQTQKQPLGGIPGMSSSMRGGAANQLSQGFERLAQDVAIGVPSFIPTMIRGAVAEPIAGLAGIGVEAGQAMGIDNRGGAQTVRDVSKTITGDPINPQAEMVMRNIGKVLEPIYSIPKKAGEFTQETFGSPVASTIVETTLTAIPDLVAGKAKISQPAKTRVNIHEPSVVREAREASEATGIELTEGQQTLARATLERQAFVQQLPAGVDKAKAFLEKQNKQASTAVDNLLLAIADDDAIINAAERFRSAANRAIEIQKEIRLEKASPLYKKAFEDARANNLKVEIDDIRKRFSDIAENFPATGKIRANINKALGYMDSGDLQRLHNAKMEIDELISSRGDDAIGNTSKRQLVQLKNDLVDRLAEVSPEYESARSTFENLSPNVRNLEESIIGRVASFDNNQLKNISKQIFDPQQTNPKVVMSARKVIESVDPDAWKMLMRAEIERRMGSIKPEIGGSIDNMPGQLQRAIFGNQRQTQALLAGVDESTKKALNSLNTALRRASLGRYTGSQTAVRQEISRELRGGKLAWVKDLLTKPLDTIVRTGEDSLFNRRVSALAEALFDPKYKAETVKLINSGRDKELIRLILSIEALKSSSQEETQAIQK